MYVCMYVCMYVQSSIHVYTFDFSIKNAMYLVIEY